MRLQRRRFSEPADTRTFTHGRVDVVELDDTVVGRMWYEPGWRWSVDLKPIAGTDLCQFHHIGVTLQGRGHIQMPDGTEMEIGPGDVFEIPPGHDAWVVGDAPWISVDFEAMRSYGRTADERRERVLSSLVFTDIVDSTTLAESRGPARWRELVARHNERAQRVIDRNRGRLVKTTGDGLLASFDSAERAVRAGLGIRAAVAELDLALRIGVHTGEVEVLSDDVRGISVHAAARIMAAAAPGEVLASSTVRELVNDGEFTFSDRGLHNLKGIAGPRQLYAVESI
jgi:class 3 adenylate cyclase